MNISNSSASPAEGKGRHDTTTTKRQTSRRSAPKGRRNNTKRRLILLGVFISALALGAGAVLYLPLFTAKAPRTALVRVPHGADAEQVRDSLTKHFGEDYAAYTLRAMNLLKKGEQAGRHGAWLITGGMSPFDAARTLERRGQSPVTVSVNSCRTPADVAALFASKLEFPASEMLAALADPALLATHGTTPEQVLCLFLEDNYEFYWTATPEEVIALMRQNYNRFWTGERTAAAAALGLSPEQTMILASIVDAETNCAEEKGTIARLYLNRLHKGMKLQSDPTVKYATGDFAAKRVGGEMLKVDNPYNTYKYEGLPPGPIRLTSRTTLEAILGSHPNPYLYMCADPALDGTHNFAASYEQHLRNRDLYVAELERRGIQLTNPDPDPDK